MVGGVSRKIETKKKISFISERRSPKQDGGSKGLKPSLYLHALSRRGKVVRVESTLFMVFEKKQKTMCILSNVYVM